MGYSQAEYKLADWKFVDMDDAVIIAASEMWSIGMGTGQIVSELGCREALIWNNLDQIKKVVL